MDKKKIGLVIQGPLMSVGRTGDNLHASPEKLKSEGGIIHYDCRPNIHRVIKEFGHLFDEIVVSVFDNQLQPGDVFPGAKIVSAPDPGSIHQAGHYKDNNKFRQFVSTLNGLNELEKSEVDYAVKTRTDTYLPFDKLLESFFAGDTKKIGATVVHPPTFLLHDLYFIAEFEMLKKFCEAILAYDKFEFISSVHREMILKHAFVVYREAIGVPDWAYFPAWPPGGVSKKTKKVFDYMFKNVYFSLHPEVFRQTVWRGAYFEKEHVDSLVNPKSSGRKYNLPALISTDWKRYFHFRREIAGKKISWHDRLIVLLGAGGWKLWNLLRKLVNMVR